MLKKLIKKVSVRDGGHNLPLVNAYNEKCFRVFNGPVLANLSDLLREFHIMTEAQFLHHVTEEKNDFAAWVGDVLQDDLCAKALLKAGSIKKAIKVVEERLKDYHV